MSPCWAPTYPSRFKAGQSAGQFWRVSTEPPELARLEAFAASLERKGQNIAGFVAGGSQGRAYSPGRIMAWSILGDYFLGDRPAAAEFWDELGGDIDDLDFIAGFAQGVLDSDRMITNTE